MNTVNLIPMSRRQAKRRRVLIQRWSRVCVFSGLSAAAVFVLCQASWMPGIAAAESERAIPGKLLRMSQNNAEARQTLSELQTTLTDAQKTLRANQSVVEKPDWSVLLMLLSRTQQDQIVLKRCKLAPALTDLTTPGQPGSPTPSAAPPTGFVGNASARPNGAGAAGGADPDGGLLLQRQTYTLELEGLGRTQSDVSQFVVRLEGTGLFDRVVLIRASREAFLSGEAVGFNLQCVLGQDKGHGAKP